MFCYFRLGNYTWYFDQLVEQYVFDYRTPSQHQLIGYLPKISEQDVCVIVDKDGKRRMIMSKLGYWYRLSQGFLADPQWYRIVHDMQPFELAKYRQAVAFALLPACFLPRRQFSIKNVQQAYHTYKGKCAGTFGGLECSKSHAHTREIVSDASNPARSQMRIVARAIRVAKKVSGDLSWSLWQPNKIRSTIQTRLAKLATID